MIDALLGRIFVFWIRNTLFKKSKDVCENAGICFTLFSYKFKVVFKR